MLAIYLAPLYLLACIYVVRWLILWLSACHGIFKRKACRGAMVVVYTFLALSIPAGFLLGSKGIGRWVNQIGNIWFGAFAYILLVLIVADLIRRILGRMKRVDSRWIKSRGALVRGGRICLCAILLICVYGFINAKI